jgi:soluble lytic murein transglycosylase-like protein
MLNRFSGAASGPIRQFAGPSSLWVTVARDTINGFRTTAHHVLMVSGIVAIGVLGVMFVKPDLADRLVSISPFSTVDEVPAEALQQADAIAVQPQLHEQASQSPTGATAFNAMLSGSGLRSSADDSVAADTKRQQEWVTKWLSKRYRVASDATHMLVSAAYVTAKEIKLDPLLILAVMAIESRLNPFAESPVGAQGLMQVMSKVHHEKFEDLGGVKAALNPVANIKVGSLILKEYVRRGGSVEAGLKMYVGAAAFETDFGYGSKVLAEYRRLKDVATGKTVPAFSVANRTPQKTREERANEAKPETLTEAELPSSDKPV